MESRVPDVVSAPAAHATSLLQAVDRAMLALATGDRLDRCGAMAAEHLASGGKRMRARLVLDAVSALGGDPAGAVPLAAATELLHNASLVHDDIQDGDRSRRGKPTVWARHGVAPAINVGDLLLRLPTLAVGELDVDAATKWELSRLVAAYAAATVRGQALELSLLSGRRFGRDYYDAAARGKTSSLLGLPAHLAALYCGRDADHAAEIASAFEDIGLLYQLQDDVLDLMGDKERGKPGSDVRQGRVSALVVEHLRIYPEEEPWLFTMLAMPAERTGDEIVELLRQRFRLGGALDEVMERIYALSRGVYDSPALQREPELRAVADALMDRVLAPLRGVDASLPVREARA